eukprot:Selendium_serpulae@DN5118_c0_g1_i1.p1
MPGLHFEEKNIRFDWAELPVNCCIFVLSAASYTPGVSLSDLTDANVFMTTFHPELPARRITECELSCSEASGAAFFYGIVSEDTPNSWQFKEIKFPHEGHTPDLLISEAKQIAEEFLDDVRQGTIGEMISIHSSAPSAPEKGQASGEYDEGGVTHQPGRLSSHGLGERMAKIGARPLELRDLSALKQAHQKLRSANAGKSDTTSSLSSIQSANELLARLQERRRMTDKASASPPQLKFGENDAKPLTSESLLGRTIEERTLSGGPGRHFGNGPNANIGSRSISSLQKDLTNVEVTLRQIEMSIERLNINQVPVRETVDKIELNHNILADEIRTRATKHEGQLVALETSVQSLHKKLDTIIECFKESGYIS